MAERRVAEVVTGLEHEAVAAADVAVDGDDVGVEDPLRLARDRRQHRFEVERRGQRLGGTGERALARGVGRLLGRGVGLAEDGAGGGREPGGDLELVIGERLGVGRQHDEGVLERFARAQRQHEQLVGRLGAERGRLGVGGRAAGSDEAAALDDELLDRRQRRERLSLAVRHVVAERWLGRQRAHRAVGAVQSDDDRRVGADQRPRLAGERAAQRLERGRRGWPP